MVAEGASSQLLDTGISVQVSLSFVVVEMVSFRPPYSFPFNKSVVHVPGVKGFVLVSSPLYTVSLPNITVPQGDETTPLPIL